jgi:hypothetical protein
LRSAATRRQSLRGAAGAALAAALGLGLRQEVLACKKNGATCKSGNARSCCSGTCARHGKHRRCADAPGAFGCTNRQVTDACAGNFTPCPDHPAGDCIVDEQGVPLCYVTSLCAPCTVDADCGAGFRCLKNCGTCTTQTGGTICVLPAS